MFNILFGWNTYLVIIMNHALIKVKLKQHSHTQKKKKKNLLCLRVNANDISLMSSTIVSTPIVNANNLFMRVGQMVDTNDISLVSTHELTLMIVHRRQHMISILNPSTSTQKYHQR
jgi:hypothetical protein